MSSWDSSWKEQGIPIDRIVTLELFKDDKCQPVIDKFLKRCKNFESVGYAGIVNGYQEI